MPTLFIVLISFYFYYHFLLRIISHLIITSSFNGISLVPVLIELASGIKKLILDKNLRDELGINEISQANPIQAALASGAAFTVGGLLPMLVTLFAPVEKMEYFLYGFTLLSLIILGALSAKTGGASITKAILRVTIWGTLAMGLSAFVGNLFGVKV